MDECRGVPVRSHFCSPSLKFRGRGQGMRLMFLSLTFSTVLIVVTFYHPHVDNKSCAVNAPQGQYIAPSHPRVQSD